MPVRYRIRFIQQAFRKHYRKTQAQSCTPPQQPITMPPRLITTESTRRLAQAQAMVLVLQCQRLEKTLLEGRGAAVSVRVVRATGLLAADKSGKSDPYVKVKSPGSKSAKTEVIKKTLNPEWDETLDLTVHDLAAPLCVTVFDYDKTGKNDNLGFAEISGLSEIAPGVPTPFKAALSKQGTVEVVVTLEYAVSVHVVRATGLLAADKSGTSDPYVKVQSEYGKKAKTSVIKKTCNPEWDETLELLLPDLAAPLAFTVFDYDKAGKNDNLGSGEISGLRQLVPGDPTPLKYTLSKQGTVDVVVTVNYPLDKGGEGGTPVPADILWDTACKKIYDRRRAYVRVMRHYLRNRELDDMVEMIRKIMAEAYALGSQEADTASGAKAVWVPPPEPPNPGRLLLSIVKIQRRRGSPRTNSFPATPAAAANTRRRSSGAFHTSTALTLAGGGSK